MTQPLVSIHMITHNHRPYIAQAIEGVLQQKVDFPIELVIGEDCSTDETRQIVLDYKARHPDTIKFIASEQNVGAARNSLRTMEACLGKYVAICEGDDYWTNPLKLQKQVSFLEKNSEYALVHSDAAIRFQESNKYYSSNNRRLKRKVPSGNIYEKLLIMNSIMTLTVLIRRAVLMSAVNELNLGNRTWMMGDYPVWLETAKHHKIHYIDESLALYRSLSTSASHNRDPYKRFLFNKDVFEVKFYFLHKYGATQETIDTIRKDYCELIYRTAFYLGNKALVEDYRPTPPAVLSHKTKCYRLGLRNKRIEVPIKAYLRLLNSLSK